MSFNQITRLLVVATVMVSSGHLLNPNSASAGLWDFKILDQTGSCCACPKCSHECKLDAEMGEEEKTCFEVECKVICIPRVVFPWQKKKCQSCDGCDGQGCSDCIHNGAKARRIRVLKTKKYECPKCKYSWSPEETCGPCCDDAGCDGGCDVPAEWMSQPAAPAAEEPLPAPAAAPAAAFKMPKVQAAPLSQRARPSRLPSLAGN